MLERRVLDADSRYCLRELQHDINQQLEAVADEKERERLRSETKLGVFVVHNKWVFSAVSLPSPPHGHCV